MYSPSSNAGAVHLRSAPAPTSLLRQPRLRAFDPELRACPCSHAQAQAGSCRSPGCGWTAALDLPSLPPGWCCLAKTGVRRGHGSRQAAASVLAPKRVLVADDSQQSVFGDRTGSEGFVTDRPTTREHARVERERDQSVIACVSVRITVARRAVGSPVPGSGTVASGGVEDPVPLTRLPRVLRDKPGEQAQRSLRQRFAVHVRQGASRRPKCRRRWRE